MARSWLAALRHLGLLLIAIPAVAQWGNSASADPGDDNELFACVPPGVTCGIRCCDPAANETCCGGFCQPADGGFCCGSETSGNWCQETTYCVGTTCQPDQANGGPCGSEGQCQSGNCVDGFCCDTPCTALCQACSATLKGSGFNGFCGNIANGTDPSIECATQAVCGQDGMCNGQGGCRLFVPGTSCGMNSCSGGQQAGNSCDGFGNCAPGSPTLCAPYVCNGNVCGATCTTEGNCIPASYCQLSTHTCQPDQANGATCTLGSQCLSGNCIDGVCCDQLCNGLCVACTASLKAIGADGVCGSIKAGNDPQNECTDEGKTSCQRDGSCNGAGACELWSNGTPCGMTTCTNGMQMGYACNGLGVCNASTTNVCSPYICGSGGTGTCATSCVDDGGCIGTYYCRTTTDHTCQPDQGKGFQCTSPSQCSSGNCVDGFCCDGPCSGTCQACSSGLKGSGANGTCGPIAIGTDPSNECLDDGSTGCQRNGVCDGIGACQLYAGGTACGMTTCTGGSQTGFACNGSGMCKSAQVTPCAPYICQGIACGGTCGSNADCVASAFCDATSHCVTDKANGGSCTSTSQCASGKCVDGVCCDQDCTGACRACSAVKKGGGADGICDKVAVDTDPDNDCAVDPPLSCQKTGFCSASGVCALYKNGTSCGASQCSGSTLTGQQCDGFGMCVAGGTASCDPYQCSNSSCATTCGDDNGCVTTSYCAGGTCAAKKAVGDPCAGARECGSGFCVESVCCDGPCNGLCQACKATNKVSGASGTCGNAKAGTDTHNDCPDDGPLSCKRDGTCNGATVGQASCRNYPSGAACGPTQCVGNVQTGYACDGTGVCDKNASTDCLLQACSSGACVPTCVNDADCSSAAYCDTGTGMCTAKHINGTACDSPSTCASGICVDGMCCDQACGGQCQACDVPTSKGTCSPVVGPAHGGRDKCPGATNGDVCTARACDGAKSIGSCVGYVGVEVGCRDEACKDGIETFSATCDGTGQCGVGGPVKTKVCQPYVCKGTACGAAPCASETDCAGAFRCDTTKMDCVPKDTATCDGDHTVTAANGKDQSDCTPYKCEASGICKMSCVSVDHCVLGLACSAEGTCVAPPSEGGSAGSCGCRIGRPEQPRHGLILAGMAALAISLRRARRRRALS